MRIMFFKSLRRYSSMSSFGGAIVFVLYICMFIFHGRASDKNIRNLLLNCVKNVFPGILITSTQTADKTYSYSTITVVLGTELLKLIISFFLYWYK